MKRSILVFAITVGFASTAAAAPIGIGDVMVSTGVGTVIHYTAAGAVVQTLSGGGSSGFLTGSAFDAAGNFFVTGFSNNTVYKFDANGAFVSTFGQGYSTPENILFDASGDVYVGNIGGNIEKFDSSGTTLDSFDTNDRVDWMDLAADQSTMYITTEGSTIHRFDVGTDTQLSDFTTVPGCSGFALRLLSGGGMLVACGGDIKRLDASGNVVDTYGDALGLWFALNLDPDGTSFWSATTSGNVRHFDIASGDELGGFDVLNSNGVWGLSLKGEIRQGETGGDGGDGGGGEVPEPASLFLLGTGLTAAIARIRRRTNR